MRYFFNESLHNYQNLHVLIGWLIQVVTSYALMRIGSINSAVIFGTSKALHTDTFPWAKNIAIQVLQDEALIN